jgi:hypothetical protein
MQEASSSVVYSVLQISKFREYAGKYLQQQFFCVRCFSNILELSRGKWK